MYIDQSFFIMVGLIILLTAGVTFLMKKISQDPNEK